MAQGMIDISVLGDKELQRKLNSLANKGAKKAVRKSMRPSMKPVLASAKTKAPVKTGRLKRGIKLRAMRRSRSFIGVTVGLPTRDKLGIPSDAKFYYPAAVEFGYKTKGGKAVPAKPFLRPALDENKNNVISTFGRLLGVEIIKEAKKA